MRIHRLRVTAFGPYAGTEEIDFEELNDAGIFLMTGPTGAGTKSVRSTPSDPISTSHDPLGRPASENE